MGKFGVKKTGIKKEDKSPAGFWIRFIAFFIDVAIVWAVTYVIYVLFEPINYFKTIHYTYYKDGGTGFEVVFVILNSFYNIIMPITKFQGTIGKVILGIKIVDFEGEKISLLQSAARFIGRIISAAILIIGFIMIGLTKDKTGLHDIIAGTQVVFRKNYHTSKGMYYQNES